MQEKYVKIQVNNTIFQFRLDKTISEIGKMYREDFQLGKSPKHVGIQKIIKETTQATISKEELKKLIYSESNKKGEHHIKIALSTIYILKAIHKLTKTKEEYFRDYIPQYYGELIDERDYLRGENDLSKSEQKQLTLIEKLIFQFDEKTN